MILLVYYALELLMSWFVSPASRHPVVEVIRRITDPVLRPFERLVPQMGGVDITPLLAFFAIYLLQALLIGAF
jgi:YggT family protein